MNDLSDIIRDCLTANRLATFQEIARQVAKTGGKVTPQHVGRVRAKMARESVPARVRYALPESPNETSQVAANGDDGAVGGHTDTHDGLTGNDTLDGVLFLKQAMRRLGGKAVALTILESLENCR